MGIVDSLFQVEHDYQTGKRNLVDRNVGLFNAAIAEPTMEAVGSVLQPVVSTASDVALGTASALTGGVFDEAAQGASDYISRMNQKIYDEYVPEQWQTRIDEWGNIIGLPSLARGLFRTDKSTRGMHTSSGDVIVPNYYNPNSRGYAPWIEKTLQKISPDSGELEQLATGAVRSKDWKENKVQNKIRKGMGFGEFVGRGIKRVAENLINPYQRAMYAEHGISPAYKVAYDKYVAAENAYKKGLENKVSPKERARLMAHKNAAIEEAHSQMQAMGNIRQQAEAVARRNDATDPFSIAASDPSSPRYFNPAQVGSGKNWYWSTGAKGANIRDISNAESKYVQNHFENTWLKGEDLNDVKVVVKKPHSQVTGDHFRDVIAFNPKVSKMINAFDRKVKGKNEIKRFESLDDLESALERKSYTKKRNGSRENHYTVIGQDNGGVWVKMGKVGTAKVEGGVNMLIKIEPNGNITGYMSDLHDFLEKTPVLGQGLGYALPKKVLAVSPPMQSNVFTLMSKESTEKRYGREGVARRTTTPDFPENERVLAEQRLREAAALKPSKAEIGRQALQSAGNVGLFANAMGAQVPQMGSLREKLGEASYEDMTVSP